MSLVKTPCSSCGKKVLKVGCGTRDKDGTVWCHLTERRRDADKECVFKEGNRK